jgi:hypothetical protein
MAWTNTHLKWLIDSGEQIRLPCGKRVPVFTFNPITTDAAIMSEWATHFRNHYCSDDEIDLLKSPEISRSQYLLEQKFPDKVAPGPSTKSGDFTEILIADYLQFIQDYYVPRTRYDRKTIGNESTKGSDVLAFKGFVDDPKPSDELLIYEVKAMLSEGKPVTRLQDAIEHSAKDEVRISESLNAAKQRLFDRRDFERVRFITRFQESIAKPYKTNFGAAAIVTSTRYCAETLAIADTSIHPHQDNLQLIVIHGHQLMDLTNKLYEKAANEA